MKYVSEFRESHRIKALAAAIDRAVTRPWTLMEVCGGQTHSIVKYGLDHLLPQGVRLIHGPGCPVCVTPASWIEHAIRIAKEPNVMMVSFGDMLRVPGEGSDLLTAKAQGADVRTVYSPLDAVTLAEKHPEKKVVFFAVGFETTAPTAALAVKMAKEKGLPNFYLLACHVLVPPALTAILSNPNRQVQGFLAAGHVCTVMGYAQYESISANYQVPIVVTGFEPADILEGVLLCIRQLESGRHEVENQYHRMVGREGNQEAQALLNEVFEVTTLPWRGLGEIPDSGLKLTAEYLKFDAEGEFGVVPRKGEASPSACIAGLVLQGLKRPNECESFGKKCRPENPLGAPMVSSEGACSAYFRYRGVSCD